MFKYLFCLFLFTSTVLAQRVYKTRSGAKYHRGTCRMVENVSEAISLEKAVQLGLSPCKICKPNNYKPLRFKSSNQAQGENKTVQCNAKTKKGTRCKHRTSIANGYCFQHNPDK